MARIAAPVAVIGALLVAIPVAFFAAPSARAQFGNIFNDSPPRPPGSVPNSGFPAQPPPVQYPGQQPNPGQQQPQYQPPQQQYQAPPQQASRPPQSNIQARPLAPPPGAAAAPPPSQASAPAGQGGARPLPAPANPPPPEPADTTPQSDDTVVVFKPTQKIENQRAIFSGLDKITGRIISFDAAIGETVQFGALQVTARACNTRPPTEPTNTDAFVEVDEVTLQGEIKRIFTGWMFAASPGLHAVEHPIYDVWLTDCGQPVGGAVAQTAPPQAGMPPAGPTPAKNRQVAPQRQAPPPPSAPAPLTDD